MGAGRWKCYLGLIFCLLLLNCKHEPRISSKNFPDKNERIETLQKHVKFFSEVENAEFELFNLNGFEESFFSTPGATSLDYQFAVKIKPEDIENWKDPDLVQQFNYPKSVKWMDDLIQFRSNDWRINSIPELYTRKNEDDVIIIFFPKEGYIFKRINQQ